jgi:prepilin-type N-terminal cleavage/methylation domain-containing protein
MKKLALNRYCGFTLVELMIAMAITAILFAGSLPRFMSYQRKQRVIAGVRQMRSNFNIAKQNALIGKKKADDGSCPCGEDPAKAPNDGVCGTNDDLPMDGWAVGLDTASPTDSYQVFLLCRGSATRQLAKGYKLPTDVTFVANFDPVVFDYTGSSPGVPEAGLTIEFNLLGTLTDQEITIKRGGDIN